jgi:hypothetical protein
MILELYLCISWAVVFYIMHRDIFGDEPNIDK